MTTPRRAIALALLAGLAAPALAAADTSPNDPRVPLRLDHTRLDRVHADADVIIDDAATHPATHAANPWAAPLVPTAIDRVARGAPTPLFVQTGSDPEGDSPADVVYTPDGSTIVIAHRESRNLVMWDATTFAFVGSIDISGFPQAVGITPDGLTAVVANIDDSVSFVDLATMTETANVPAAENPGSVVITPSGDLAAIGLKASNAIAVYNIATQSLERLITDTGFNQISSFSFEPPAVSLQFSEPALVDDDRIINADPAADEAQIINIRTGAVTRIPIADNPRGLSVSLDRSEAIISHASSTRTLTRIDLATETVIQTLSVSTNLTGPVALNDDATAAVVAVQNAAFVLDLTTSLPGPSLNTASVNQFLVTPDGSRALAAGFRGSVIAFDTQSLVANTNNQVSCQIGAMSPTTGNAAMCSTTFGDDLVAVGVSTPSLQAFQLSGPVVEGDRCRTIAISADGTVAVGVSIFSDTASIIDTATGAVLGTATVGQRPSAVAITPDGTTAVVGNLDSTFASVIDLATATTTNVPISRRAGSVQISPDGRFAYLGVVADGDGVWRIDLNTNSVLGPRQFTANMGGVGYSYGQSSPIFLSPDGNNLVVPGAFDDQITIIDAATWFTLLNVNVGDFPTTAAFSPDQTALYIANKNDDTVSEINLTLAVPAVVRTFNVGDQPWQIVATDTALYVHEWGDETVRRIDRVSGASISAPLPDRGVSLDLDEAANQIVVASGTSSTSLGGTIGFERTELGFLSRFDADTLALVSETPLDQAPSAAAIGANGQVVAMSAPTGDGVMILDARTCAVDINNDGAVDVFDILDFLTIWNAQGPGSDFNASGTVDVFDILDFLTAWNAGCP